MKHPYLFGFAYSLALCAGLALGATFCLKVFGQVMGTEAVIGFLYPSLAVTIVFLHSAIYSGAHLAESHRETRFRKTSPHQMSAIAGILAGLAVLSMWSFEKMCWPLFIAILVISITYHSLALGVLHSKDISEYPELSPDPKALRTLTALRFGLWGGLAIFCLLGGAMRFAWGHVLSGWLPVLASITLNIGIIFREKRSTVQ